MKQLLLFAALILSLSASAHSGIDSLEASLRGQNLDSVELNNRRYQGIRHSMQHGRMVWFTGQEFNVQMDFSTWLQRDMSYYMADDLSKPLPNGGSLDIYRKRYVGSGEGKPGPVTVKVYGNADQYTIARMEITGDWNDITRIFTRYWMKPLNLSGSPATGAIAWVNSFGDKVTIYATSATKGKIVVEPNGVINQKRYYYYPI